MLPDLDGSGNDVQYGLNNFTARKTIHLLEYIAPSNMVARSPSEPALFKGIWRAATPLLHEIKPERNPFINPNLESWLADMSRAFTTMVRKTRNFDTDKVDNVNGKTWQPIVKVKIRWRWIILPVVLLMFSLIFLLATVIRSTKQDAKVGIWKTSALAVLFNGLGEDVQETVGNTTSRGYARSKAKDLKVKLEEE